MRFRVVARVFKLGVGGPEAALEGAAEMRLAMDGLKEGDAAGEAEKSAGPGAA